MYAITSESVLSGSDGFTTSTLHWLVTVVIGMKSLCGVGHLLEQRVVRDMREADHHNGVAVGRRACGLQVPSVVEAPGRFDHQHVLPETLLQALLKERAV
jgi:hypothetical protein